MDKSYSKLKNMFSKYKTNAKAKFREFKDRIKELEDNINRKNDKISKIKEELKEQRNKTKMYKDRLQFDYDETDIVKMILKLYAENKLIGRIHKQIQAQFDTVWEFDRIQKYLNIENLEPELRKYYYEKQDNYEEVRQIEDNRERMDDIENLNYLLNRVNIIIENADLNDHDDKKTFLSAVKSFTDLIDKKKSLNKELGNNEIVMDTRTKNLKDELDNNLGETFKLEVRAEDVETG